MPVGPADRGRSRGPIIALVVIATVVLVDGGDDVDPGDIEVDIGEDG